MTISINEFIKIDNPRFLFPLHSTERYLELGEDILREFIYESILDKSKPSISFNTSPIAYALKDKMHLRKMLLLDPISTFYIYDFVLRNWKLFDIQKDSNRQYYGYAFDKGIPLDPFPQYHNFRRRKYQLKADYKYYAKVDIANCFNCFYHHEIVSYLHSKLPDKECNPFGQFLREINAGKSINCFPQGIYPAKALGNGYLSFSETSMELQSPVIIRFLDDFFIFANSLSILERDIIVLQQLIGSQALFLNEEKTQFGSKEDDFEERNLDQIKKSLIQKREEAHGYDEEDEEDEEDNEDEEVGLEPKEVDYLKSLIQSRDVAEEDVELALSLLKEDEEGAPILIELVFNKYPNLIKDLYRHLPDMQNTDDLWTVIIKKITSEFVTEYELFWIVRIILDLYGFDQTSADVLLKIFNHTCASPIVKSAILEFTDNRFGFGELKMKQLRSGSEGIIATSAVAGLERLEKAKRNQIYKYISKASPYLNVLCNIMSKA
jgi:hypothetical protein